MGNIRFVSVSGFSASGSSAVVDLLKEYKDTYECSAEIRLIQDPYGIHQLDRALTDDWNYITSAAAIRDFLWLCKMCGRKGGGNNPFARAGLSYTKKINKDFYKISENYIRRLSDYTFTNDYYYQKFKKPYILYVYDRIALGLEHLSKGNLRIGRKKEISYFAHPDHDRFNSETQIYFEELFKKYIPNDGTIILDQAVSVNDPDAINRYFRNGKLIIVDRDPRDMYVDDIVNWGSRKDISLTTREAGRRYIANFIAMHERIDVSFSNVLVVRFEDLVLHYEKTVSQIEEFLSYKMNDHIKRSEYLKPEISSRNVGIWKKYYDEFKDAIDVIQSELESYCWKTE